MGLESSMMVHYEFYQFAERECAVARQRNKQVIRGIWSDLVAGKTSDSARPTIAKGWLIDQPCCSARLLTKRAVGVTRPSRRLNGAMSRRAFARR